MKIYFGDLTHETITISNEAFPLNVGYVAAYLLKAYPDAKVEIFKYPSELKERIDSKVPDILALSNYPWNRNLSLEFFRYVKSIQPKTLTLMGGPNISYGSAHQLDFLRKNKSVLDFYVMFEGEEPFSLLYQRAIDTDCNLQEMKKEPLPGIIFVKNDNMSEFEPIERRKNLDEIPSPYLEGLFDKFFDGKLTPIIETHRGCPYKCTFCHEGNDFYTKINRYGEDRIISELKYICSHAGDEVTDLIIADPNFGLFKTHIEIAEKLAHFKSKFGYPKSIIASSAKNSQKNLIQISQKLGEVSYPIWMSVQSLDDNVLENIKRKNISINQMLLVQDEFKSIDTPTKSEVIMSLPGETLESHIFSIVELIKLRMDLISTYQLMLVNGSEMHDNEKVQKDYCFDSKYRVLPRNITKLAGNNVLETEEIVVATKDFPFTDYITGRILHLIISIFYNGKVFAGFFKFALEEKLDIRKLIEGLIKTVKRNKLLSRFLDSFINETKGELFDSEEAVKKYFADDKNFSYLVSGELGGNLLQKYTAIAYMKHSITLVKVMNDAFLPLGNNSTYDKKLKDITEYYRLSFTNFLNENRLNIVDKGTFSYNIQEWLKSENELDLFSFYPFEETVEFKTDIDQYETVNNYLHRYGYTAQAFGKIMTRLWIYDILRKPNISNIGEESQRTKASLYS